MSLSSLLSGLKLDTHNTTIGHGSHGGYQYERHQPHGSTHHGSSTSRRRRRQSTHFESILVVDESTGRRGSISAARHPHDPTTSGSWAVPSYGERVYVTASGAAGRSTDPRSRASWSQHDSSAAQNTYNNGQHHAGVHQNGSFAPAAEPWTVPVPEYAGHIPDTQGDSYPDPSLAEAHSDTPTGFQRHDSFFEASGGSVPVDGDDAHTAQPTTESGNVEGRTRFTTVTKEGIPSTHFGPWGLNTRMVTVGLGSFEMKACGTRSDGTQVYRRIETPLHSLTFHKPENFTSIPLGDWLSSMRLQEAVNECYPNGTEVARSEALQSALEVLIPKYYHEDLCNHTPERGEDVQADWDKVMEQDTAKGAWWADPERCQAWTDEWLSSQGIQLSYEVGKKSRGAEDARFNTHTRSPRPAADRKTYRKKRCYVFDE
ncbi:hypothetical protein I317_03968 [Kwoniella heveanensis CBS 569]|nr:hypothetical protein I317_03968 [Kwoniella heveanensis CBS 569]